MSGEHILFETAERGGSLWRLALVSYKGRQRVDWRKYWRDGDGELKPTRQGVQFAPERLSELRRTLEDHDSDDTPDGPENGS